MKTKEQKVTIKDIIDMYLEDYGLHKNDLAVRMHISNKQLDKLISGKTELTQQNAILLAKAFETSKGFWITIWENNGK